MNTSSAYVIVVDLFLCALFNILAVATMGSPFSHFEGLHTTLLIVGYAIVMVFGGGNNFNMVYSCVEDGLVMVVMVIKIVSGFFFSFFVGCWRRNHWL